MKNKVFHGDNLAVLKSIPDESIDLIYVDPPFNTGVTQTRELKKMTKNANGSVKGFKGETYNVKNIGSYSYSDSYYDFLDFLKPRLVEAKRVLSKKGTLYVHLDYREVHYVKVFLDELFGRNNFLNELIWAYDYGGKAKKRWPTKHDTILVYVKDIKKYHFSNVDVDREPYMAPGLVTEEKAKRGKLPTDVWWYTIVSPTGKEKTGYPTQKPLGILKRIISASSKEGETVLDFFAGSGTTGEAAAALKRNFILVDENADAVLVIRKRFAARMPELDVEYIDATHKKVKSKK
ncbi:MAG: site-specific DNA-methyltransferase [Bifidobacteriaceae bacterium]|jgi:site-specific DNA-methyltransferase (adenine-specific)|nr:site-specific DNA-methyltransferase [Bifidobacteriaceae bacterium]